MFAVLHILGGWTEVDHAVGIAMDHIVATHRHDILQESGTGVTGYEHGIRQIGIRILVESVRTDPIPIVQFLVILELVILRLRCQSETPIQGVDHQFSGRVLQRSFLGRLLFLGPILQVFLEDTRFGLEHPEHGLEVRTEFDLVEMGQGCQVHRGQDHLVPVVCFLHDRPVGPALHHVVHALLELEPRQHPILETELDAHMCDV